MYSVYFIKSFKKDWVYVGSTQDLKKRVYKHNQGLVQSTKVNAPYKLIYCEIYLSESLARKREMKIKKSWSVKEEILKRLVI